MGRGLPNLVRILIYSVALAAGLILILIFTLPLGTWQLKEGDISPLTIKSPRTIVYKSEIKTKEVAEQALESMGPVYKFDPTVSSLQKAKIEEFFKSANQIIADENLGLIGKVEELKKIITAETEDLSDFIGFDPLVRMTIKDEVLRVSSILQEESQIKQEDLEAFSSQIFGKVDPNLSTAQKKIVTNFTSALLLPNTFIDKNETKKQRDRIEQNLTPVFYTIVKDQVVATKGQMIDALTLEKLNALGIAKSSLEFPAVYGWILLLILISILAVLFFNLFASKTNPIAFLIFFFLLFITALSSKILIPLRPSLAYAIPAAAPIIILLFLLGRNFSLFAIFLFAGVIAFAAQNSFEVFLVQLIACLVAIYFTYNASSYNAFLKTAFFVAVSIFVTTLAFHLINSDLNLRTVGVLAAVAGISGLLSSILALGTLPIFGNILGVVTFIQLFDLGNPAQPLLKRLSLEAPGTYHHSIMVANLAERAAKAVGADQLLLRVATYYHDIGKLSGPIYYIENQTGTNIHDEMDDPIKSTQIVLSHLEEGVNLVRKSRFPKEIINIISEHHGTTAITYFYEKAHEKWPEKEININDFRYPGPKPRTKEAAVLMLADAVEAAVRSIGSPDQESIKNMVDKIINNRISDGQLDDSPLTFRDIEKIRNVFINTLLTMYHSRVEYPDEKNNY